MNVTERQPVAYLRKSFMKNADNDLQVHRVRIERVMAERGEINPYIINEPSGHRSAYYSEHRPGYQELMRLVRAGRVSTLYCNDRARLWRNDIEWLLFLYECKKYDTEVVAVTESKIGDVSDPRERIIEFLHGNQNQAYRDDLSARQRNNAKELRHAHVTLNNRGMFGAELVGHKFERTDIPNQDFPVLLKLLTLYLKQGCSARQLSFYMVDHKLTWRVHGKPVSPKPATIQQLFRKFERYEQVLTTTPNLEQYADWYPQLYADVLAERNARRKAKSRRHARQQTRLLAGVLFCAKCGDPFYPVNMHREGNRWYYGYMHKHSPTCRIRPLTISCAKIDGQFREYLNVWRDALEADKETIIAKMCAQPEQVTPDYEIQRKQLNQRLNGYKEMRADGDISKEEFRAHKEVIESKLAALPTSLPPPAPVLSEFEVRAYLEDVLAQAKESISNRTVRLFVRRINIENGLLGVPEWAVST